MSIDDLTVAEAKKLAAMFSAPKSTVVQGGNRPVIVRSRDAGVQFGYPQDYSSDGSTVTITNARQMWAWVAAEGGTLLDCATHGVSGGKFSTPAKRVVIISACAIIDCTHKAVKTLESQKWL